MRYVGLLAATLLMLPFIPRPAIAVPEDSLDWPVDLEDSPEITAPNVLKGCSGSRDNMPGTFDESLCSELNFLQSQIDKIKLSYAENLLDRCFRRLKSAFSGTKFQYTQFCADVGALEKCLMVVGRNIQIVQFPGKFPQKVAFEAEMLQVLRDCARFMDCYKHMQLVGHELVYSVIESYAEAMSMHDEWGNLDKSVPEYTARLCRIRSRLAQWEVEMDALPDVSLFIYIMFRDQRYRVRKVIEKFWKQIAPPAACRCD